MRDYGPTILIAGDIMDLIHRGRAALAHFEELLIAEIIAGSTTGGTPMAACGRVALGLACALARDLVRKAAEPLVQPTRV